MSKKKILILNEASHVSSGFGNISKYLIPRLVDSNKYEIAELACYGLVGDKQKYGYKHRYYPNAVIASDPRYKEYKSKSVNDFGEWRFDRVLLDFRPDCVVTFRDFWMDSFIKFSPYRKYFNWVWMNTYDSYPNEDDWIETYESVDRFITYTDWAAEKVQQQSRNIKYAGTIPPGVDLEIFKPKDKRKHRTEFGFYENSIIFGTVMRNQKRKLYPDLFKAFKKFLEIAPKSIADKSYLYCHTCYPDMGWNMPSLLKRSGISDKVLFTYVCKQCDYVFASYFQDARNVCPRCKTTTAILPGTSYGINHTTLNDVYNLMDCYIQYSICLPQNTLIKTKNGHKKINDISLGEEVLTHNNRYRKVLKIFENPNQNNMFELQIRNTSQKLKITGNHPIYAIKKGKSIPEFINTENLFRGDMLVKPVEINYPAKTNLKIDEYNISKELCKLFGLYLAKGSINKSGVTICLPEREFELVESVKQILNLIKDKGSKVLSHKNRKAVLIKCNSVKLVEFLNKWFSVKEQKKIPDWLLYQTDIECQKEFLHGYFLGCGKYLITKQKTYLIIKSQDITKAITTLIERQKIRYTYEYKQKYHRLTFNGNFKIYSISDIEYNNNHKRPWIYYHNDNIYYTIFKNKKIEFNDNYVYNIEVEEDNSYVTELCAVHNCEGIGIPLLEAGSCGLPLMAVDATGMKDIVKNLDATPLKVAHEFTEFESHSTRVYPNNNFLAQKMLEFALLPESIRQNIGNNTRKLTEFHYNWDLTAQKWFNIFDNIESTQNKWNSPIDIRIPNLNVPEGLDNNEFVKYALEYIMCAPELINSHTHMTLLRDLNYGVASYGRINKIDIDRNFLIKKFAEFARYRNICEELRCGLHPIEKEDFILEAYK